MHKKSEIRWIGNIPNHWEVIRVKHSDIVIMGQSPNSNDYNLEKIGAPFLQGNADFTKLHPQPRVWCNTANKIAEKDDVLVSVRAPIGSVNIADQAYGIGRGLCAIRPNSTLSTLLFYYFIALNEELNSIGTGSTYTAISVDDVKNTPIPKIPLPEQRAIADFLDRKTAQIGALIAKKQRQIELLQEHRTALINQAVTKGLNPDAPMKDSDIEWLGEIPRHWEVVCLKYLLQNGLSNGIFKKKDQFGQGTKLVNVSDLYQDNFLVDFDSLERVQTNLDETEKFLVSPGDIFFVRSSLKLEGVGVSVCITNAPEPTVFECHVVKASPNKGLVNPIFLIYYLNSFLARHRLVALAETVTMTTLRQSQISSLEIAVPPLDEQSVIFEYLVKVNNKIQNSIRNICSEIEALGEYRTALISAAVTGKIDVRTERD